MSLLNISTKIVDSIMILRLKGELDHHTSHEFKKAFDEARQNKNIQHLVLNVRDLTFMDSSGLGVILGRYKQIEKNNGRVILCALNPTMYRIFELAGLFKIITMQDSEEAALKVLGVA